VDVDRTLTRSSRFLGLGGLVAIVFGIVLLVWPNLSLVALLALFGAFFLVYGVLGVAAGLSLLAHRSTEWVPFVLGGLAGIAIGAVTFFRPDITALVLVYVIAAWAIVTGIFEIVAAVDAYEAKAEAWWLGIAGVLSIVFGAIIAIWPGSGVLAILWLIGIYSIVLGVMRVVYAYRLHTARNAVRSAVGGVVGTGS
jgi:uncharacterized membrane protein HdeD (DUF308 family)